MIPLLLHIGRLATPAAMIVFLTYEITKSLDVPGGWGWAVGIGAALTAVGIEATGILSGHALEGFARRNDTPRAVLAFVLLGIYTAVGLWLFWNNPTIRPIPIVAAVVYLVAALTESLRVAEANEATQQARAAVAEDTEAANELAIQLAKIEATARTNKTVRIATAKIKHQAKTEPTETKPKPNRTEPKRTKAETKPNQSRGKIKTELETNPKQSNAEIGRKLGVSAQYVGRVRSQATPKPALNGQGANHEQ